MQVQPPTDDGLTFDPAVMRTATIRDEDAYSGLRLTMRARHRPTEIVTRYRYG